MISELVCTVCFANKPKYLRQCKCFYCEDCKLKSTEICVCGLPGCILNLSQVQSDEYKYVAVDTTQLYKKITENMTEKMNSYIQSYTMFFSNVLDMKTHQEAQLQRFLNAKIKNYENEIEDLKKKKASSQPPFEIKENFSINQLDQFKFSTPRGMKPTINGGSISKKPFYHEGFSNFFGKK